MLPDEINTKMKSLEKFVNLWIIYSKTRQRQTKEAFFVDKRIKVLLGRTNYISTLTKEKKSLHLWTMYLEALYFIKEQGINLG